MKRILLALIIIGSAQAIIAQNCADLFISEYLEGSFNEKALELYNPTADTIDLSNYQIGRYRNGAAAVDSYTTLNGMLLPYETYVIVIDKRNPAGTGNEAPVSDSLQAKADTFVNPEYDGGIHPMYFNGDDGLELYNKATTSMADLIGKVGEQPNNAWSSEFPHTGAGQWYTRNHTLTRKKTVQKGVTSSPSVFDPTLEWDLWDKNIIMTLGCHESDCDPNAASKGCVYPQITSIATVLDNGLSLMIYPNPFMDEINVKSSINIESVEIMNVLGKTVVNQISAFPNTTLKANFDLPSGVYFMKVNLENDRYFVKQIMKN